jgi:protein AroM
VTATPTVAYLTIGETPRDDLVPELRAWIALPHRAIELGVLDGVDDRERTAARPDGSEARLVTRLVDGSEIVLRASWAHERMRALIERAAEARPDVIVLLCTGHFELPSVDVPVVTAQSVVDYGTLALAEGARTIGIMVPHPEQARAIERGGPHADLLGDRHVVAAHASPYAGERLRAAASKLGHADMIVMHCMGYDEAMRAEVRSVTGGPVLLARRMVAGAIRQLL